MSPGSGEGQSREKAKWGSIAWERERSPIKATSCRTLGSRSKAALGRMEANDPDELGPLGLWLDDGLSAPLHYACMNFSCEKTVPRARM